MNPPRTAALVIVLALTFWAPASGQRKDRTTADTVRPATVPRTPDGRPDLQGFWTTQTFTPLERPPHLAGKEFFTEEEFAALQQRLTATGVDPLARNAVAVPDPAAREEHLDQTKRPTYVHYDNALWLATAVPKGLSSRRTSLITDPKDGRIPPLTEEAKRRIAAAAEARRRRGPADSYEARGLGERCIEWDHEGPPILPPAYNDLHQILQTPDYVVIFPELTSHIPRMIPLDGRPHISDKIRLYPGDSRGRWEGDTLVVETTNLRDRPPSLYNDAPGWLGGSPTAALRVVERFTRIDTNRIHYAFTVDDPATWTRPWSAEVPLVRTAGPMYEYACHEGNHSLRHILEIQRNLDRQAADVAREGRK